MIHKIPKVSKKLFDYVIVGAGTAGSALAACLSENPGTTVAILEAGESHIGDPKVSVPGQLGHVLGNEKYDWAFFTTKQKYSSDQEMSWYRGKGLGRSSAINFYVWI